MTKAKTNWKALLLEARNLIEDEVVRHGNSCGCQDEERKDVPNYVEGLCPGLQENKDFIQKTKHLR